MVAGAVLAIGAAVVGLFVFKDQIGEFLAGQVAKPITDVISTAGGVFFDAGADAGRVEAERQRKEQIFRAEQDLENAAKEQGFGSLAEFNLATDSGAVVIGGTRTVVDFGLIGDVLPTDPSPEFLANPEKFLTKEQLLRFNKLFSTTTRGTKRFGGQTL